MRRRCLFFHCIAAHQAGTQIDRERIRFAARICCFQHSRVPSAFQHGQLMYDIVSPPAVVVSPQVLDAKPELERVVAFAIAFQQPVVHSRSPRS